MTFIDRDGAPRHVDAPAGHTLLEIAHANALDIEGTCGGNLACATCHVVVADDWYGRLPAREVEERDMLDLAWAPTPTSRLGCQIVMDDAFDGLVVRLPDA